MRYTVSLILLSMLAAGSSLAEPALSPEEKVDNLAENCAENADAMKQRQEERTLYSRLGGEEGIEQFSTHLYAAHKSNEQIGDLFTDVPEQPFIENVTAFLVAHSGGGGEYTGKSMTRVHKDLGITHEDFLVAGGDVQQVMTDLGHGENEIQEAVCFLVSLVPQVVTK